MLTLGSLFDGIGTWQLAALRNGIQPLWSSEIDNFCRQVTRRHFPQTIQLGDINHIDCPPLVDIITASSPCQDLSVAGKRSGLNAERSGLFFKAIKLVRRIRPKFFIWENVPNVLNIRGGNDFATVLSQIAQTEIHVPQCGFANAGVVDFIGGQLVWRILDAQFFGVAQRRRRIFLVADFTGRRAAKILFEPASLSRNSATRSSSQRHAAGSSPRRSDPSVFGIDRAAFNQGVNAQFKPQITPEISATLTARGASAVATNVIRKLTPVECERLMGLPDDWSAGGSDTARYRALGNAVALPCANFIFKRLMEVTP